MGVRDLRSAPEAVLRVGPEVRERVRWRDVDAMGIVYYANYVRFMEAAESEFFAELGFPYGRLADEFGVWIARVHLACDYRAPARLDDEVVCRAELRRIGRSSLTFGFPIDRADGTRLADGALVLAAVDRETLRPVSLPAALRSRLLDPAKTPERAASRPD